MYSGFSSALRSVIVTPWPRSSAISATVPVFVAASRSASSMHASDVSCLQASRRSFSAVLTSLVTPPSPVAR